MATFTAWGFPAVDVAELALEHVKQLQKQEPIKLEDAALVSWPAGNEARTRHLNDLSGAGALGGTFWGMPSPAWAPN